MMPMPVHVIISADGVVLVRSQTFADLACVYQHGKLSDTCLRARQVEIEEMMQRWHNMGCKPCREQGASRHEQ